VVGVAGFRLRVENPRAESQNTDMNNFLRAYYWFFFSPLSRGAGGGT